MQSLDKSGLFHRVVKRLANLEHRPLQHAFSDVDIGPYGVTQELLDAVWPDIHVTEGVLKRAVPEIRKALDDPVEEPRFIQTLHRRGYRFLDRGASSEAVAEVSPQDAEIVGRT